MNRVILCLTSRKSGLHGAGDLVYNGLVLLPN